MAFYIGVDNRSRVVDSQGRVLAVETGQPTQYLQITGVARTLHLGECRHCLQSGCTARRWLADELSERVLNVGVADQIS